VAALQAASHPAARPDQSGEAPQNGSSTDGQSRSPLWFLKPAELVTLQEAVGGGLGIYVVEVVIDPACTFKGPRAYTVLRALEAVSRPVATWPSREALEEERFDDRFLVAVVSDGPPEPIRAAALGVSEVRAVNVTRVEAAGAAQASGAAIDAQARRAEAPPQQMAGAAAAQVRAKAAPGDGTPGLALSGPESTIRVETARLDALVDLVGELVISSNQIQDLYQRRQLPEEAQINKLGRITSDLQNAVMRLRMVPLRQVFSRFPRAVRDLARRFGKQVTLVVDGEETELDRTIVNEIGDPLLHLIRNAVDHGIEPPAERERLGKPRAGRIRLSAHHEGNHVVIELEDDGRGLDVERIRRKAVENGRLSPEEAQKATPEQLLQLIFEPGFSTADKVTDVSGRGVGMDAARAAVEALGGRIAVHTRPGRGTLCVLRLPLTLAIIEALLVETDGQVFAVPAEAVQSIERVDAAKVETVHGQTVIRYRDGIVPLISLDVRLGFEVQAGAARDGLAVVISTGRRQAAILVERVVGLQDLVIRTLGSFLKVPGVAGAAILGSGRIALILDPLWLV
ncbi:MAG: chemotaxis protein CheA, partial [Bacillota bacterium]